MIIYLICFIISALLIYLSQNKYKEKKALSIFLIVVALLIPCILAGLRSDKIGTDVNVYVKPLFGCAKEAASIKDFVLSEVTTRYGIVNVTEYEYGFIVLIYFVTKLFSSLNVALFFIQLMIIIPIYFGIRKFDDLKDKQWLCMLVYYLLFYGMGLNIMRQMIGMAIIFYATCSLIKDKASIKFIILTVLAMLFHITSVLGIIIFITYHLLAHDTKYKLTIFNRKVDILKVIFVLFYLMTVIIVFNSKNIIDILNTMSIKLYSGYIVNNITISVKQMLLRLPIMALFIIFARYRKKNDKNWYILFAIAAFDLLFANISSASVNASRIGYIFEFMYIISLPMICDTSDLKINKMNTILTVFYSYAFWLCIYVYYGSSEIIPYVPFWK